MIAAAANPADDSDDIRAVKLMVQLTCSRRSLHLANSASNGKRKTWCPSVKDCLQSFIIFAQVCVFQYTVN